MLIEVLTLSPGLQIILWSRQGKNFYSTRRPEYIISGCLGFWVFLSVVETITGCFELWVLLSVFGAG